LFERFRRDFNHLFSFNSNDAGNEFISFFITGLYCRLYIAGQTIVNRGESFDEIYMIFEGKVVVSLNKKFTHEFFMLHATNYFGDYQILLEKKSTENYTAYNESYVRTHCMKASSFWDILTTFPDAMAIFVLRCKARRKEFRHIRKTYERWVGFSGATTIEKLPQAMKDGAEKLEYSDEKPPPFLKDTDFYFIDSFKARVEKKPEAES
jgi:hypothetical protein